MKQIDVRDQVNLPFSKCVELVLSGIKYRLFRAAVTVTIISLAVAFLMNMLTESVVTRRITQEIDQRLAPRRLFLFWLSRISSPMTAGDLSAELAKAPEHGPRWKEWQAWSGLDETQLARLQTVARRQRLYLSFFQKDLDEGERRPMVGRVRGAATFELLQDAEALRQFEEEYVRLGRQMPTDLAEFKQFLSDWAETRAHHQAVRDGHKAALAKLKETLGDHEPKVVLAGADEALLRALAGAGFQATAGEIESIRDRAALNLDAERLARLGSVDLVRQRLRERLNVQLADLDEPMFFDEIASSSGANWLVELTGEEAYLKEAATQSLPAMTMSPQRVREAAASRLDVARLAKIEASIARTAGDEEGFLGFSSRTMWLITVSFVVCVVGIANAMLMSVTERFREIATMKCLGATDAYIMTNFILESCLQGTAGGVVGTVLGFLLGTLRSLATYGWMAMEYLPAMTLLAIAGVALVVGVILSAMAAVYPAWIAARLAPMEAMRIE